MNPQLNNFEKAQLLTEVELVCTYQTLTGSVQHGKKGKNGQLVKQKSKYDCHSQTYLLKNVWGIKSGSTYIHQLKDAVKRGVDSKSAQVLITFG